MRLRVFVLLLVGIVLALPPLAQASPPDQTWIGGFYDNADHDDVVLWITSASSIADTNLFFDPAPTRIIVGSLPTYPHQSPPTRGSTPQRPRAPPAS